MSEATSKNWNFRVMKYPGGHPKFAPYSHGIHEVYYDENGIAHGWTEDAIDPVGFALEDLEWRVRAMLDAFTKPVLEYELKNDDQTARR